MNISDYFEPVNLEKIALSSPVPITSGLIGSVIQKNLPDLEFPDIDNVRIAIFGVCDDRRCPGNEGCAAAPDAIRSYLYALAPPDRMPLIADLGNLIPTGSPDDTQYALAEVTYKLLERNIVVVVLGGGQEHTFGLYKAYEVLGKIINICSVSSRIAISENTDAGQVTSANYLRHIVEQMPNYLFNFNNLCHQSYFVSADTRKLMESLMFDAYRLGEVQHDMDLAEAALRNSHLVSLDISAVRQSDAPGQGLPSPHGLYGEEMCRLARFAGLSDNLSTIGFFGMNPRYDSHGQTAHMYAHALWYFIEGFCNRKNDYPYRNRQNYKRFVVDMADTDLEIVFYKSKLTDRWWFEIPNNSGTGPKSHLIPCTYQDYERTQSGDLPPRWWKFYQRYND